MFRLLSTVMCLALPSSGFASASVAYKQRHVEAHRLELKPNGEFAEASQKSRNPEEDADGEGDPDDHEPRPPFVQATNGSTPTGYMQIGTPPKWLLVIMDTGSNQLVAKTWDTLQNELASIDQGVAGMVLPSDKIYNHNSSSSYAVTMMKDPTTNQSVPARNEIAYGSGVAITDEGNESVQIGDFMLKGFPFSEITADSLQMLHTNKGISGVLGLQHMMNKSLGMSLFSQMREEKLITAFGYCRRPNNTGLFMWGDTSQEGTKIDVVGQMHWAVKMGSLSVAQANTSTDSSSSNSSGVHQDSEGLHEENLLDKHKKNTGHTNDRHGQFPDGGDDGNSGAGGAEMVGGGAPTAVPKAVAACEDMACCAILDTGSNILAGPSDTMKSISDLVNVAPDCSNYATLPNISLLFGGKHVEVTPKGYVMKVELPSWAKGMGGGGGPMGGGGDGDGGDGDGGDGDGGSGYFIQEEEGMGGGSRSSSRLGWKAVLRHLHKKRGIDLSVALKPHLQSLLSRAPGGASNSSSEPDYLCMPALVPLDKKTEYGPLYIVGTPLLETHYARWSFPTKAQNPHIFIQRLSDSDTCKKAEPTVFTEEKESHRHQSHGLIRSEGDASPPEAKKSDDRESDIDGPMVRSIDDIAFPHWARSLVQL